LLDQIELAFEELESSAAEDELAAEQAVTKTTNVAAFTDYGIECLRETIAEARAAGHATPPIKSTE
jgi:hypothetical protein